MTKVLVLYYGSRFQGRHVAQIAAKLARQG
jgi:hypothetical protein